MDGISQFSESDSPSCRAAAQIESERTFVKATVQNVAGNVLVNVCRYYTKPDTDKTHCFNFVLIFLL